MHCKLMQDVVNFTDITFVGNIYLFTIYSNIPVIWFLIGYLQFKIAFLILQSSFFLSLLTWFLEKTLFHAEKEKDADFLDSDKKMTWIY